MALSNSMVAHKWTHGESGKGSNSSTDGKRLISYSTDVAFNTGRGLVFISSDNMSRSTGKQLSHAWRAVSHLDVVYTPIFKYGSRFYDFDEKQAFKMACSALNDTIEGHSKARLGKYLASSINHALQKTVELNDLALKYGFGLFEFFEFPVEKLEAARVYAEQWDVKDAARRETARIKAYAAVARQRENDLINFTAWRAGTLPYCPVSYRNAEDGSYYIAVRDGKVVTSGGAECPIEHARVGVAFWASRLHTGIGPARVFEPWHRNGQTVQLGTFQLDRIESDGTAYAGCHKFNAEEINRLYHLLV